MAVNLVILDGVVHSSALRYGPDSKPEFRFTLVQPGEWPLYVPCYAASGARPSITPAAAVSRR